MQPDPIQAPPASAPSVAAIHARLKRPVSTRTASIALAFLTLTAVVTSITLRSAPFSLSGAGNDGTQKNITNIEAAYQSVLKAFGGGRVLGDTTTSATSTQFRYLRIELSKTDWVSLNEVEVYDDTGRKISLDGSKAVGDIGKYPQGAARLAVDGNPATSWNAGETATNGCNWDGDNRARQLCLGAMRKAAWSIDLGSVRKVSRIRFSSSASMNESDIIAVSNDNYTYVQVAKFVGTASDPFGEGQWREFPAPKVSYSGNPVAGITVNGSGETTVQSGPDAVIIAWNSANADKATFSVQGKLGDGCPYLDDPYRWRSFPASGSTGATGNAGLGDQFNGTYLWQDLFKCSPGGDIVITFTVSQRDGGKSASASAKIHVKESNAAFARVQNPNQPSTTWGYEINANYFGATMTPGGHYTGTVQVNLSNGQYANSFGQWVTSQYPRPNITAESGTDAFTVSLGQSTTLNNGSAFSLPLTISSSSSIRPGIYKIRLYGNKGAADQAYYDIPVFVFINANVNSQGISVNYLQWSFVSSRGPDQLVSGVFTVGNPPLPPIPPPTPLPPVPTPTPTPPPTPTPTPPIPPPAPPSPTPRPLPASCPSTSEAGKVIKQLQEMQQLLVEQENYYRSSVCSGQ